MFNCFIGIISPANKTFLIELKLAVSSAFVFAKYERTLGTQHIIFILCFSIYSVIFFGNAKSEFGSICRQAPTDIAPYTSHIDQSNIKGA